MYDGVRPVFVGPRRLRARVPAIPVVLLVTGLVVTDCSGLAGKGPTFTGALSVATLVVGFSEELLFRGTGAPTAAMLAHGWWDLGVLSTRVDPARPTSMEFVAFGAPAVILPAALGLRRRAGRDQASTKP